MANGFIDMTGWKMWEHGVPDSQLFVINRAQKNSKQAFWNCKCTCGKECCVIGTRLRNGNTKSCGCARHTVNQDKLIDMTGWVMKEHGVLDSRITVICRDCQKQSGKQKRRFWKCLCECGNIFTAQGWSIKNGQTKSCGCYAKEQTSASHKKYNRYEFLEKYCIIYANNTGSPFIFDKEDYEKVKNYSWHERHGYLCSGINGKIIAFHDFIFPNRGNNKIDHKDTNRKDNRKSNLRIANNVQNAQNKGYSSKNTSGFIGVYKVKNGWMASIGVDYKSIYLGAFKEKEDAICARLQGEIQYFGEFMSEAHKDEARKRNML